MNPPRCAASTSPRYRRLYPFLTKMSDHDVKCQICEGRGHTAAVCPNRKPKRSRDDDLKCQLCGGPHSARTCPTEGSPTRTDQQTTASPTFECKVCCADKDDYCEADCIMADERGELIDSQRTKSRRVTVASASAGASAAGGGGGGGGGGGDENPDSDENPSASDILKMSPSAIASLHHRLIVMLPATWLDYIWAGPPAERVDRHRALKEAVSMAAGLHSSAAKPAAEIHPMDTERTMKVLSSIFDLLDPSAGPLDAKHRSRIRSDVKNRGLEIVAYREARSSGWKVARKAMDIYTADSQVDKLWTQAVKAANAQLSPGGGAGGRGPKPTGKKSSG